MSHKKFLSGRFPETRLNFFWPERKSDIKNPQNNTYRHCVEHLKDYAQVVPYFQIYPFNTNKIINYFRDYKEKWKYYYTEATFKNQ